MFKKKKEDINNIDKILKYTLIGLIGLYFIAVIFGGASADGIIAVPMITAIAYTVYFFPTMVASKKGHHNLEAIFVLNILTGWTFLGWLISLVWGITKKAPNN